MQQLLDTALIFISGMQNASTTRYSFDFLGDIQNTLATKRSFDLANGTQNTPPKLLDIALNFVSGTQNAFVLKQGIKRENIFIICLICAISDAALIFIGVYGLGSLVQNFPHHQANRPKWRLFIFAILRAKELSHVLF